MTNTQTGSRGSWKDKRRRRLIHRFVKGIEDYGRGEQFGQDHGGLGGILGVDQDQGHAGAVEALQFFRNDRRSEGVVSQQHYGVDLLELLLHGWDFNAGTLVYTAVRS